MGSQTPALEKLFDEWAAKHAAKLSTAEPYMLPEQEAPYGGFVRDGIVNLESWKKQKVRICFILNEAGGRNDMEHYPDGADLAAEWNERGSFSKFMFKLSVWTKAIQDAFNPPITYNKGEVAKIRDDLIRSIAVVNIKKSDGQRRSDFEILQRFANEDAEEIKKELELVNPNIIVCSENMKFLRGKRPEEEGAKRNFVFYDNELKQIAKFSYIWGSKLVLSMWSPANFLGTISSNTLNYYAVREISRAALKALSVKNAKAKKQKEMEAAHERKVQEKAARAAAKQSAQPTATPPQPTATPPQPAVAPPQPTAAPPQPTATPPQPAVAPPQPTVAPPQPTETPAKPKKTSAKTKKTAETSAKVSEDKTPTEPAEPAKETKPKTRTRAKKETKE